MIHYDEVSISLSSDIPALARLWRNHPEIFRYCRQTTLINIADHDNWISSLTNNKTVKMFGIHIEARGSSVGVCGLTNIDYIAHHAEFSLYIAPEYQGQGYGQKALYTLLRHGFEDFNLNKIWGECFEGNPARKMFLRMGFVQTQGHYQHYFKQGRYINTDFFTMTILAWDNYGHDRSRNFGESRRETPKCTGPDQEC